MSSTSSKSKATRSDPVGELLVDCMDKIARGDHGAIEALCAAHPEHAAEIRERMTVLLQMGLVEGASEPSDQFPERLGEFRLTRRLGGGGMGVVYEALQEKLGRTVALKLIRPEHLYFPRARERFRRETEAVARLQHPSIVSIYTVGEERGIPYFAMELVRGSTLDDVLAMLETRAPESLRGADLRDAVLGGAAFEGESETDEARALFESSWTDACVRIVLRIAEALAHAHSRGVLHRDIKPSNIAITPSGRVVLLDFGLASQNVDVRMTTYGTAVGSVLYMAPEQIDGKLDEIDERTDVYALGVTLCEILTLQAPYSGKTADEVKLAILGSSAPSLRARNRRVSRDLENVCTKAIDGERGRRYASMADFAADLQRALSGEPVHARPPGRAARLGRWIVRHPTGTTAAALAAILVIGVPSAAYFQQRTHNVALERALESEKLARNAANEASRLADAERDRARIEADNSVAVSRFLVDIFSASDPRRSPTSPPTAEELLRRGVERIDKELANQPRLRVSLLESMAESFVGLALFEDARPLAEQAVALRRELDGEDAVNTAWSLCRLATIRRQAGDSDQGIEESREAIRALQCRLGPHAKELINPHRELAVAYATVDRQEEAARELDAAQLAFLTSAPGDVALHLSIVAARGFVAMMAAENVEFERASLEVLSLQGPSMTDLERINPLSYVAGARSALGRHAEALPFADECLALARVVFGESSSRTADYISVRASVLAGLGRLREAVDELSLAIELVQEDRGPAHPHTFAIITRRAEFALILGEADEAVDSLDRAAEQIAELLGQNHTRARYMRWQVARTLVQAGRFDEALERLQEELAHDEPLSSPFLGRLIGTLADAEFAVGNPFEARRLVAPYRDRQLTPGQEELELVIARLDLDLGDREAAIARLEQCLRPQCRFTEEWAWNCAEALLTILRAEGERARIDAALAKLADAIGEHNAIYLQLADEFGAR